MDNKNLKQPLGAPSSPARMQSTVAVSQQRKVAETPKWVNFAFGGTAGMAATMFVQPLDLIKNRMQLSGEGGQKRQYANTLDAIVKITRNEGVLALYNGIGAGLLRQATYTTTRLGVYTSLFERLQNNDGVPPSFAMKAIIGIVAGGIGAFVGTPAEICLIRMTADGRLPLEKRRNYTSVVNALTRISREEGVLALWRGCVPTIGRAMIVNAVQLATYSQAKQQLLTSGYFVDGILTHFVASMISGLATTAASMPVDIAKTRLQNMKIDPVTRVPEYTGAVDVLGRVVRSEGFFSLWKGFTPYYARLGPHTVLTFIFLEQMNAFYKRQMLDGGAKSL